jgi:hypothetical protein
MVAIWKFPVCLLGKVKDWKLDRRVFELSVMEEQKSLLSKWPDNWLSV